MTEDESRHLIDEQTDERDDVKKPWWKRGEHPLVNCLDGCLGSIFVVAAIIAVPVWWMNG